jgi:Flp pilus assembly protein TadG
MRSSIGLINRFRSNKRGNVAVIFAIAIIPLIGAVGAAIDYSEATRVKAKLQSAADAAAVASISQRSNGWIQASTMTSDGSVSAGVTDANNIFDGNANNIKPELQVNSLTRTSVVTKTGNTLNATVNFSAVVPATFMTALGFPDMAVSGVSKASATLPMYLDFYLALDVSGSMGLPSTTAEAARMQAISPDNWVQYRTGCTLACHFAPQKSACTDPPVTSPTNPNPNPATNAGYSQQYNTNNYCMGYVYSRLGQTALAALINQASTVAVPKQKPGLPKAMLSNLTTNVTLGSLNSLVTGNANSLSYSLNAVTSCATAGTDACIQLRLDAVGMAVNQLLALANTKQVIANQFRIGLYPFIEDADTNYAPLTTNFTGSAITTAAANLASELDTNTNATLGSGGTHIDVSLNDINGVIKNGTGSVGNGSSPTNTLPYVFLVTDGAQDPQMKGVPNGGWSGSNHATVLSDPSNTFPNICTTMKSRGIIVSVLYVPYQTISPVNASFANDEDDAANANIANIPQSLQNCASPPDSGGSYFYTGNTPDEINTALQAMFNHSIQTAHITN